MTNPLFYFIWHGETYIIVNGSIVSESDVNTFNWEYFPLNESSNNPCLIEGTPINMADGTEKPVELVHKGDIVLSYDPNTNT